MRRAGRGAAYGDDTPETVNRVEINLRASDRIHLYVVLATNLLLYERVERSYTLSIV